MSQVIYNRGSTPNRGQPITSRTLDNLASASGQGRVQFGGSVSGMLTPGGGSVFARRSLPSQGSSPIYFPYEVFLSASATPDEFDVVVNPGTVNGLLTSNILSKITQPITSTMYVNLTCTSDGFAITESTISVDSDPPDYVEAEEGAPPSSLKILLGMLYIPSPGASPKVYQVVYNSLIVVPSIWIQITDEDPVPFGNPFTNYYIWNVSEA